MYQQPSLIDLVDVSYRLLLLAFVILAVMFAVLQRKYVVERARRRRAENHVRILQGATAEARDTFQRYAQIHNAKRTEEGEAKAMANLRLADTMTSALRRTGYRILSPIQESFAKLREQMTNGPFGAQANG